MITEEGEAYLNEEYDAEEEVYINNEGTSAIDSGPGSEENNA
ncbi:Transcriptional regulator, MarR family [Halapricum desulfuricans]|uniref:Transcriptional regulator, MarR family n=1 Tax=Halapricum desulfuricans TaxID=2841257 RepID=A0A897MZL6_9EURY|nr:Transcriptional regulator, MarR family [Halapricum desulfuricans]